MTDIDHTTPLNFISKKKKRWLTITIFLSVTCYNVTMLNNKYYTDFFELGQQKINFSFFELHIPDDDPLKKVMEECDFYAMPDVQKYSLQWKNPYQVLLGLYPVLPLFE